MSRTPEAQAAWEQGCYGCTGAESRAGIDELVRQFSIVPTVPGANMALGSILSDAQELIETNTVASRNQARQYLNRVKQAIFEAAPIQLWEAKVP